MYPKSPQLEQNHLQQHISKYPPVQQQQQLIPQQPIQPSQRSGQLQHEIVLSLTDGQALQQQHLQPQLQLQHVGQQAARQLAVGGVQLGADPPLLPPQEAEAASGSLHPKLGPSLLLHQQPADDNSLQQQLGAEQAKGSLQPAAAVVKEDEPGPESPADSKSAPLNAAAVQDDANIAGVVDKAEHQQREMEEAAARVPGRDLKQEMGKEESEEKKEEEEKEQKEGEKEQRAKRAALTPAVLCENDPLCADKFDRNPLADSGLLDRSDPARLLRVGSGGIRRSLLAVAADSDDTAAGAAVGTTADRNMTIRTRFGTTGGLL